MYTVINQCCPNRCLATCSSTVVTPTQVVPLVLFTVQFFLSHVWATHSTNCSSLSLLPILCVHCKSAVNISSTTTFFFKVFSHRFHFEICNKKQKILLDTDTVRAALQFCLFCPCEHVFPFVDSSRCFPVSCFFLGKFPLSCLGCPFFCFLMKHDSL
jgi:hypothetical protein